MLAETVALGSACGEGDGAPFETTAVSSSDLTVCAEGETLRGIDVSEYQGTVDWPSVAASGLSFALARVSDGTDTLDPDFSANWSGIKAAGMVRGVYQFFRASEDPVDQANLLVNQIGTLEPGDLSPIADIELLDGESGATLIAHLATWVDRIQALTGRVPIVYASPDFWEALPDTGQFSSLGAWVADWGPSCPDTSTPWTSWQFWQYADDGTVPGIQGPVDLDRFNGTLAQLGEIGEALSDAASYTEAAPEAGLQDESDTPTVRDAMSTSESTGEDSAVAPEIGDGKTPEKDSPAPPKLTNSAAPGCACQTARRSSSSGALGPALLLGALGAALVRRRRSYSFEGLSGFGTNAVGASPPSS